MAAGWWIFFPTLSGDWIWDDSVYLARNSTQAGTEGLRKIWLEPGSFIEYYPVEQTVQWIQWQWWHKLAFGYHATNIFLHILSGFLVWRLLGKLGLKWAWLGGLLFIVHPITVDSVSWISELKNTLSLPPFLLAMSAWVDYEDRGRKRDYWLALGLFLVAMLCKITMAPFPIVILLYAWWKRGGIGWGDVKASVPFFAVSILLVLTTIFASNRYSQAHSLAGDPPLGDLVSRLACAGLSLSFYLGQCLWPAVLLPIYPKWSVEPPSALQFLPWLMGLGCLYGCWRNRTSWGRHVLLGLGFFVIMLAPFLGFRSISYMSFTWVMDHFAYIPLIGLVGLAIAGLDCLEERISTFGRPLIVGLTLVVAIILAIRSHAYAGKFADEETLWTYTVQNNAAAWPAHNNLGNAYLQKGWAAKAVQQYEQALQLNPDYAVGHNNLGIALEQLGQLAKARAEYEQAVRIAPAYTDARDNLARLK